MLKTDHLIKLLLLSSGIILLTVYYIEYIMGIYACNLCKFQRIPFFVNLVILTVLTFNKTKFIKLIYVLILSIIVNICISFYHVGIEQSFFTGTKTCKESQTPSNKEDLLKQLKKKGVSDCSKVEFTLFGLSLSTLNFVTNIVFLGICVQILRYEKK